MAGIVIRFQEEYARIMALRGLTRTQHGPQWSEFRNDAFALYQGARVHQDVEEHRFCVTALLRDGAWVDTNNITRMGECEFLFYLEHLLPFAQAALLVDGDAVNAVWNLWVVATGIPGLEWSVFENGRYTADRAVFELRVRNRRPLWIMCFPADQWGPIKFRVEYGANDDFEFVSQKHADGMRRMYDILEEQFGNPDPMIVGSSALAVLERAVAALV